MSKPSISYFDRETVAVADHDHRLITPKQALTRAAELVTVAREAQRMTLEEIRAGYDAEQAKLREEFPEQFAEEADERADRCTCPMSVREARKRDSRWKDRKEGERGGHHSRACPLFQYDISEPVERGPYV